jgi:hypothetical protein
MRLWNRPSLGTRFWPFWRSARDVHLPPLRTLESAFATEQQADVDVGRRPEVYPTTADRGRSEVKT